MRVVHFNTFDSGGGAANASLALHKGLSELKIDSTLLVYRKTSSNGSIVGKSPSKFKFMSRRFVPWAFSALHYLIYNPLEIWSFGSFGSDELVEHPLVKSADIISLSWVSWFLDVDGIGRLLRQGKPVVWTCYDMWAFTGGCHYSGECENFMYHCNNCPQLGTVLGINFPKMLLEKKKSWDTSLLTVVCPSKWLANCVRRSSLFHNVRIRVIPSGVDTNIFKPMPKDEARDLLGLPLDRKLVLFVASRGLDNERKGGKLLESALHELHSARAGDVPDVVILGGKQRDAVLEGEYVVHKMAFHDENTLASLYAACDILVAPSKSDNLPLTILQAMACGTPCVAFDIGGMSDVIEHTKNGYLARPFDIDDLASGIDYLITKCDEEEKMSQECVNKIYDGFTAKDEASQYISLYKELLV